MANTSAGKLWPDRDLHPSESFVGLADAANVEPYGCHCRSPRGVMAALRLGVVQANWVADVGRVRS
jgi:hypothetical protein